MESPESEGSERDSPTKPAPTPTAERLLAGDIIELTSSSEDEAVPPALLPTQKGRQKVLQEKFPSYISQEDDGAILKLFVPLSIAF